MTELLFRADAYLREARGRVVDLTTEGGVVLDATIFCPTAGGQPGDAGQLAWSGGSTPIAATVKGADGTVVLLPAAGAVAPTIGVEVTQTLDWARRYAHMRVHTALHLLSVVIPLPVTGGQIGTEKGRLDFDMPDPPADLAALQAQLDALVARDLPVTDDWISDADLMANPSLVKTMSVQPPMGQGRVRLVRIGSGADQVDLQPCGGTHVARTGEIGSVLIGKIENKGRQNRRVTLHIGD